jgi:hypothetical protein
MLHSHILLGLLSEFFPTEIMHAFFISPISATFSALLDLNIRKISTLGAVTVATCGNRPISGLIHKLFVEKHVFPELGRIIFISALN